MSILVLIERELLSEPVLYLSRYIIQNKAEYYRLLLAVTAESAWEEWTSFLLDALFEQPYCRISTVMTRCRVSRPTATKWLKLLADNGVLTAVRSGKHLLYVNTRFFTVLTRIDRAPAA